MSSDPDCDDAVPQVLVIGGGIAGIAAALRVRALDPYCHITIADSAAQLGGKIASDTIDGCVVDGAADVCIGDKLRATHMFADLGLDGRVVPVNPNNLPTYTKLDGRLQRLPTTFSGELLTFRGGMRDLVTIASAALSNVTVLHNSAATSITPQGSRWLIEMDGADTQVADSVILAIPAQPASVLLADIIPDTHSLATLEYRPTTTVTMAWHAVDVPHALDGTGYLIADDASPISACTWISSKNPSHSSPGTVLLRGYLRGTDGDPASLMRAEVATVLDIKAPPLFVRVYEWQRGLPTYTPAHEASVRAISEALDDAHGIFIAGSAFHGAGIPDCIHSGERAAAAAVSYLAALQPEEAP